MIRRAAISLCALVSCAAPDVLPPHSPPAAGLAEIPSDASRGAAEDAEANEASSALTAVGATPAIAPGPPEEWLKGSTHVHGKPSGDSATPVADVIAWYERAGYDFIVLTDHNKVSELEGSFAGQPVLRAPANGLIVLAGIELTHNPAGCVPKAHDSDRCRIHVNLLGVTGRPQGKVEWADRGTRDRAAKYAAALAQQQVLGGIAQINHPNWYWGMTAALLAELAQRGVALVEIANVQFAAWNHGDPGHPGIEALWDGALARGARVWGVASDDAHDYAETGGGRYPAGGGWVVVKARRDPQAILAALAAGRFYASTGVVLERAGVEGDELVVEVGAAERGTYEIEVIENDRRIARVTGRALRRALPETGYVRAVVIRGDGARAWVQPAWR